MGFKAGQGWLKLLTSNASSDWTVSLQQVVLRGAESAGAGIVPGSKLTLSLLVQSRL